MQPDVHTEVHLIREHQNEAQIDLHLLKMCVQYELLVVSGKLLVIYVHNLCYYHP